MEFIIPGELRLANNLVASDAGFSSWERLALRNLDAAVGSTGAAALLLLLTTIILLSSSSQLWSAARKVIKAAPESAPHDPAAAASDVIIQHLFEACTTTCTHI